MKKFTKMLIVFVGSFKSDAFKSLVCDSSDPHVGGAKKQVLLVRSIVSSEVDVEVISTAVGTVEAWNWFQLKSVHQILPEGCVKVDHPLTFRKRPFWYPLLVFSVVVKVLINWLFRPPSSLVVYNCYIAESFVIIIARWFFGIPTVVVLDDLPGVRGGIRSPKVILERICSWFSLRCVDSFVLVNNSISKHVRRKGVYFTVLPGIVDDRLLRYRRTRCCPFSKNNYTLFYCGGLSFERGVNSLIDLVDYLPEKWRIVVAGAGPMEGIFKELDAKFNGKIKYLGCIDDDQLFRFLCEADAVINPLEQLNDSDGVFPFKVIEYIASGSHVISVGLPHIAGCNIEWIQRWTGLAADLPRLLNSAHRDYREEKSQRDEAEKWVLDNCLLSSLNGFINKNIKTRRE